MKTADLIRSAVLLSSAKTTYFAFTIGEAKASSRWTPPHVPMNNFQNPKGPTSQRAARFESSDSLSIMFYDRYGSQVYSCKNVQKVGLPRISQS